MGASPLAGAWASHTCTVAGRPPSIFCTIGWVGGHCVPLVPSLRAQGCQGGSHAPGAGSCALITTISFAAPCEYEGKQFSLGESWLSTNCLLCTCLHPIGVGCCET